MFVEDSSLLQAAQGFSENAGQCGQYHSAVGQPPPVCYARLPPNTRSDLLSVKAISVEALPRGQSVYETSAIPQVTSGVPHGAVLDAWLDSVTKQPHESMQQSIAVAGVEESDVCGTRQPKAFGSCDSAARRLQHFAYMRQKCCYCNTACFNAARPLRNSRLACMRRKCCPCNTACDKFAHKFKIA